MAMHESIKIGVSIFLLTLFLSTTFYVHFQSQKAHFKNREVTDGDDHITKYVKRIGYDLDSAHSLKNVHPDAFAAYKTQIDNLQHEVQVVENKMTILQQQMSFANPFRAIGAYQSPPLETFNSFPGNVPIYDFVHVGLKHNPSYCDIVDTFNLMQPNNVYKQMNFVGDYTIGSLIKEHVFNKIGKDVAPEASMGMRDMNKEILDLDITATAFFTKRVTFHNFYEIGRHFMCASQMYNHIPGHGVLTRKDLNVKMVNDYSKRYQSNPQCFNKKTFFPYAYRLDDYSECTEFFEELKTQEYSDRRSREPITFILKKGYGAHRASGLEMFDQIKEVEIRTTYQEGQLCGEIRQPWLAQYYVANPLLLDKRNKFDFRIYMLVASVDPLIVYYHDGFLRVSLQSYDKNSTTESVHFTNTHLSKQLFQKARDENEFNGMNETELRDYQMWTMEDLQEYLLEAGLITDENWLNNYLRPKFKEAYLHTVRMSQNEFFKHPGVFEMFGLDFLLDEDLGLWFIECNASPQLVGTSDYKTQFLSKMLAEMFDIQYAYLRSRWRRIQKFMGQYRNHASANNTNMAYWQSEFAKINTNYLEPEFPINKTNGWQLIMDANIGGKASYLSHIRDECIDDA